MKGSRALPSRARESLPRTHVSRAASSRPALPSKDVLERQLQEGVQGLPGVDVSSEQIGMLCAYCGLVALWNRAHNLIGAQTLPEIVPRHILDSLTLSSLLPPQARRILDIGTGAGLPGFPLAVVHPDRQFTLLDRSPKKTRFVRQAKLELGMGNVEVVTGDASDYQGGPFGCIMARAVSTLAELVRCSAHLIAPDGICLLPKGSDVEQELRELPPGWKATVEPLNMPAGHSQVGTIVVLHPPGAEAECP